MRKDQSTEKLGERVLDLLHENRNEEALACCVQILAKEPKNSDAWMGRFLALVRISRCEEAMYSHRKAMEYMTPEEREMCAEALAEKADTIVTAFEDKVDELELQQEKIGFNSESERREYYQEGERMVKEVKETVADHKRRFPNQGGRSKKKRGIS